MSYPGKDKQECATEYIQKCNGRLLCCSIRCRESIDDRVAEALLNLDNPSFIYELQQLNGNPGSCKFDVFWEELRYYIEELAPAVDDRCHLETPHMPVSISLHHLLTLVKSGMQQKYPNDESKLQAPSVEWLRLQF